VLLVCAHASVRGMPAALAAAFGIQAGNGFYFLLSVLGLATVLLALPGFFLAVQLGGAAYLAWSGVSAIRSTFAGDGPIAGRPLPRTAARPFAQGAVKQLANPKSSFTFFALLPQFMDPAAPILDQSVILAVTAAVIEVPVLALYGWLAALGRGALADPARARWRERLSGSALLGIAGFIVWETAAAG
jgi:homoserine/homoserine lactone efflux protein